MPDGATISVSKSVTAVAEVNELRLEQRRNLPLPEPLDVPHMLCTIPRSQARHGWFSSLCETEHLVQIELGERRCAVHSDPG